MRRQGEATEVKPNKGLVNFFSILECSRRKERRGRASPEVHGGKGNVMNDFLTIHLITIVQYNIHICICWWVPLLEKFGCMKKWWWAMGAVF